MSLAWDRFVRPDVHDIADHPRAIGYSRQLSGSSYDRENRLSQVTVGGSNAQMGYDYTGRQVWKVRGATVARYYSPLAEVRGTRLAKYYFAGGLRIAERVTDAPAALASLPAESPAVRLAGGPGSELVLTLRPDVARASGLALAAGLLLLFAVPGRRRAVVGMRLRRGPVLVVLVATSVNLVPLRWGIRTSDPLLEIALGAGEAWGQTTTEVNHYHLDRLGSTTLVTRQDGTPRECVRYMPYGEVLGRYACPSTTTVSLEQEPEFTGYETDALSGLQYAGARFYDPALGMFLTHDPMREFANPYTYTAWDPVNVTDPSGMCIWDLCIVEAIIIGAAVGFTAAAIQAGVNGASFGQAMKAGAIGGAIGAASAAVGAYVLQYVVTPSLVSLTGASQAAVKEAVGSVMLTSSLGQAEPVNESETVTIGI